MIGPPNILGPIDHESPVVAGHPLASLPGSWFLGMPGATQSAGWADCKGTAFGVFGTASGSLPFFGGSLPGQSSLSPAAGAVLNLPAGSSAYVDLGDPPSLAVTTGSVSLECWVNMPAALAGGNRRGLLGRGPIATISRLCVLVLDTSERPQFQLYDGSNNPAITHASAINGTGWRHLVGVRSRPPGGTNILLLYVDGVLSTSAADPTGNLDGGAAQKWTIGGGRDQFGDYFRGQIAHARIYAGVALSAAQVRYAYEMTRAGFPGMLRRVRSPVRAVAGVPQYLHLTAGGQFLSLQV